MLKWYILELTPVVHLQHEDPSPPPRPEFISLFSQFRSNSVRGNMEYTQFSCYLATQLKLH